MYLYENIENEYLEDLEKTGTHKRRLAKITMYLEVPSLKTDKDTGITTFKTESEIENEIDWDALFELALREYDGVNKELYDGLINK